MNIRGIMIKQQNHKYKNSVFYIFNCCIHAMHENRKANMSILSDYFFISYDRFSIYKEFLLNQNLYTIIENEDLDNFDLYEFYNYYLSKIFKIYFKFKEYYYLNINLVKEKKIINIKKLDLHTYNPFIYEYYGSFYKKDIFLKKRYKYPSFNLDILKINYDKYILKNNISINNMNYIDLSIDMGENLEKNNLNINLDRKPKNHLLQLELYYIVIVQELKFLLSCYIFGISNDFNFENIDFSNINIIVKNCIINLEDYIFKILNIKKIQMTLLLENIFYKFFKKSYILDLKNFNDLIQNFISDKNLLKKYLKKYLYFKFSSIYEYMVSINIFYYINFLKKFLNIDFNYLIQNNNNYGLIINRLYNYKELKNFSLDMYMKLSFYKLFLGFMFTNRNLIIYTQEELILKKEEEKKKKEIYVHTIDKIMKKSVSKLTTFEKDLLAQKNLKKFKEKKQTNKEIFEKEFKINYEWGKKNLEYVKQVKELIANRSKKDEIELNKNSEILNKFIRIEENKIKEKRKRGRPKKS